MGGVSSAAASIGKTLTNFGNSVAFDPISKSVLKVTPKAITEVLRIVDQISDSYKAYAQGMIKSTFASWRFDLRVDDFTKNLLVENFKWGGDTWTPIVGKDLAYEGTYWAAIIVVIFFTWYLGPEFAMAIDYIAALIMEEAAIYITSIVLLTTIYYTMTATAFLVSAYLMAYLSSTLLGAVSETYFMALYGVQQMMMLAERKKFAENDFSNSLLNGSIYDWMAGGIALNSVMTGGDISVGFYPNDPYTKAFMYESKDNNIMAGVLFLMPYDNLAGGDMFGLNGNNISPYSPLSFNI